MYNIYIMLSINKALSLQPDFFYVVDEETAYNVVFSLKKPGNIQSANDNPLYEIPINFNDCFENFINQTILIKKKSNKILRIKPIEPIEPNDNGGLTYLNGEKSENPFKEEFTTYFGGELKYNSDTAIKQLNNNLVNLKRVTGETGNLYIIARMINLKNDGLLVFISKIQPPLPPPRTKSSSSLDAKLSPQTRPKSSKQQKYFYKYLKYKQKYLEAQQLYVKELKGGVISEYIIYCSEEIYNLIEGLNIAGFTAFKNLNCFFLTLGFNSYYSTNEDKTFINCWTTNLLDATVKSTIQYKTFNLSLNNGIYTIQLRRVIPSGTLVNPLVVKENPSPTVINNGKNHPNYKSVIPSETKNPIVVKGKPSLMALDNNGFIAVVVESTVNVYDMVSGSLIGMIALLCIYVCCMYKRMLYILRNKWML